MRTRYVARLASQPRQRGCGPGPISAFQDRASISYMPHLRNRPGDNQLFKSTVTCYSFDHNATFSLCFSRLQINNFIFDLVLRIITNLLHRIKTIQQTLSTTMPSGQPNGDRIVWDEGTERHLLMCMIAEINPSNVNWTSICARFGRTLTASAAR